MCNCTVSFWVCKNKSEEFKKRSIQTPGFEPVNFMSEEDWCYALMYSATSE
jgi:hypothetical protein